jgi:hypothetical protein
MRVGEIRQRVGGGKARKFCAVSTKTFKTVSMKFETKAAEINLRCFCFMFPHQPAI